MKQHTKKVGPVLKHFHGNKYSVDETIIQDSV